MTKNGGKCDLKQVLSFRQGLQVDRPSSETVGTSETASQSALEDIALINEIF